jgi:hypothetical protein
MSGRTLRDCASFVRSKNSGPFTVTIDIFFATQADFRSAVDSAAMTPAAVAPLYGVSEDQVRRFEIEQALAIKFTLPRPIAAGDFGDRDVAGGQQFLPLLGLVVDRGA